MIPFNKPAMVGQEFWYMQDSHRCSVNYVAKCEELLAEILGTNVLLTTSGTAALEVAAMLLDVGLGDEVIVPAFTHPATASAFARLGA
ncbi:unnamed protein product, partial [marine sediment metagenome]